LGGSPQPFGSGSSGLNGPLKLPVPAKAVPGRAKGGPVRAGRPYLVGEEGPEIIVPKQSGMVVPNHAISLEALMEMKRAGKNIVLPKGAAGAKFFESRPAPQRKACRSR
jgi:phage-related minor tail protein